MDAISMVSRRTLLKAAAASVVLATPGTMIAAAQEVDARSSAAGNAAIRRSRATGAGGLSPARLRRLHDAMGRHVESGRLPGVVTLVSRKGETHVDAIGTVAFGSNQLMRRDTIFRIASITKPITAAAAMMLIEEGKLRLDDPVDDLLPELSSRKVLKRIDSPLDDTVPANRPITVRDVMTFRLGYGAVMVFPEKYPIQKAMSEAGVSPSARLATKAPDNLMEAYGSLPLVHQPGEQWLYNSGSDILGVLIARASGKSFGAFLKERIFDPLGMTDTGFSIPAEDLDRLPTLYSTDFATMKVVVFDEARTGWFAKPPPLESGAGGLVSTVDDYLAFCQMMLNKGVYRNERLLSRLSVEVMTTDQITPEQKAKSAFFPGFWDNRGWGFGMSIITRRDGIANVPGRFGWDGGYGTSAYADPTEQMIGILMTQRVWDSPAEPKVVVDFWNSAYQAIDD